VFVLLLRLLQAVAYRGCFPDASPLISMAAALLDLQHYCPALLAAAADAALQQGSVATSPAAEQGSQQGQQQQGDNADSSSGSGSSLAPEEVVSLLLALGFFRVPAPDFVESALEVRPRGGGCSSGWLAGWLVSLAGTVCVRAATWADALVVLVLVGLWLPGSCEVADHVLSHSGS
jgi:hypothetical protein